MLPAGDGDCLFVQAIGTSGTPTTTILIDGGRADAYGNWKPVVQGLVGPRGMVDLVVVTHIDADHIGGIIAMLGDGDRGFEVGGIWYNGHPQVVAAQASATNQEVYSVAQADDLSAIVERLAVPWNVEFEGGPIHSGTATAELRVGEFAVAVVTPARGKLAAMLVPWTKAWEAAKPREEKSLPEGVERFGDGPPDIWTLAAEKDENDTAKPNGSSIGLMLEAFGQRLLLVGDCHPTDLATGLTALANPSGSRVTVDILKVSHHGARTNTTAALLKTVEASTYAFSTDGSRHEHPDQHVVAKIIVSSGSGRALAFNYRTHLTEIWDDRRLKEEFGYETLYPDENSEGHLRLSLPAS